MARDRKNSGLNRLADRQIPVVEDRPLLAEILTARLTLFDHRLTLISGREALNQIKRKRPNVVLLDLTLPDMTGLELARLLRQNKTTKSIRILAMSGSVIDKQNWLEAGCDDFILKPFDISTLLARLSKLAA